MCETVPLEQPNIFADPGFLWSSWSRGFTFLSKLSQRPMFQNRLHIPKEKVYKSQWHNLGALLLKKRWRKKNHVSWPYGLPVLAVVTPSQYSRKHRQQTNEHYWKLYLVTILDETKFWTEISMEHHVPINSWHRLPEIAHIIIAKYLLHTAPKVFPIFALSRMAMFCDKQPILFFCEEWIYPTEPLRIEHFMQYISLCFTNIRQNKPACMLFLTNLVKKFGFVFTFTWVSSGLRAVLLELKIESSILEGRNGGAKQVFSI